MFPGMVFAVLSRDPDFVRDVAVLLRNDGPVALRIWYLASLLFTSRRT